MAKRWLIVGAVLWGLVAVGLALYSERNGRPTTREQTTVAEALATVDAAVADLAGTLDPAGTVAVVGGYTKVGGGCDVTVARAGVRYERVLTVYTKEGTEAALVDRLSRGLPQRYRVKVTHLRDIATLTADPGNFVAIRGATGTPGQVRISADTGCRVQDRPVAEPEPESPTANRAPIQALLDSLSLTARSWHTHRVACPAGGALWTVEAVTAPRTGSGPLPDTLRAANPGAAVLLARSDVYAYRSGPVGVVVRTTGDALTITSTTGCSG